MTDKKSKITIPLNRVEGDLELTLELGEGIVTDSWSRGVMYRGFENMLKGRAPKDGLVLTPRVCGICGTAHLLAAAKALDMISQVRIPVNALLVRNLTSMAEHLQSDMRQAILMFMKDFINPAYRRQPFFKEALKRYDPFKGSSVLQAITSTKQIVEIIAIIGGQWPLSSFMVPGGVASTMTQDDIISCRYIVSQFKTWYEKKVLGCSLQRWAAIKTSDDLERWYDESESHRHAEIGFFLSCARVLNLEKTGKGYKNFLSFGQFELPEDHGSDTPRMVFAPGFYSQGTLDSFNQQLISEHVTHSCFEDYAGGLHPFMGETTPFIGGPEHFKYSFAKAPRYQDKPAETGPLAEMLCSNQPLFVDLLAKQGGNTVARQLARFSRAAVLLPYMEKWLGMIDPADTFYTPIPFIPDGKGYGLTSGSRGALGHWVVIEDGEISKYQIITPTSWNGSPRDSSHARGPWEEAVIGTEVDEPENPVTVGHIIRSFDPCQVCSVHTLQKDKGLKTRYRV